MNITPTGIAVTCAVVIAIGFLLFGPVIFAPFDPGVQMAAELPGTAATDTNETSMPTELSVSDQVVGTGAIAEAGDTVTMNYVGAFSDGTVFDASEAHGQPFTFTLGAGSVIAGWEQGIPGMREGGKRTLVIPPSLGYGAAGAGNVIPPNTTLLFQVELLKVEKK